MPTGLMQDAFDHHIWATKRLAEACRALTPDQLSTLVAGTYGSILETLRHIVHGDWFDLAVLTRDPSKAVDASAMDLAALSGVIEALEGEWSRYLAQDPDPSVIVNEVDPEDGFQRDATIGLRLAGVLWHGNEHRAHVCTAFTVLGLEPPKLGVFDFGLETGRTVEVMPS